MNHIGIAQVEEVKTVVLCRSSYANKAEGAARCAALVEQSTGVYVTPELWPASCEEEVREYADLLCRDLGAEEWQLIEVEAVPGARARARAEARAERLAREAEAMTASAALALLASQGIAAGVNAAGILWINAPAGWSAPEGLAAKWSGKRDQWWCSVTLDVEPSRRCTRANLECMFVQAA